MALSHIPTLMAKKRDGLALSDFEIREFINAFTAGEVSDAQMSAWCMAVFFAGMNPQETLALTLAMRESGEQFVFPTPHPLIVDRHSTGGIGDKVSLILAPLVAVCGAWIPMVSGRGLGITGGTLDKLESIPGFCIALSIEQAMDQLQDLGVVMMGQTERFCPADRKLYALRDVTATVPSIPLITASILSKKLAENLDRLVLDVKYGSGAFMKSHSQGEALARSMIEVGEAMGVRVKTQLNPMNEPLGRAVGNALEVIEAIEIMRGGGPADVRDLVISQAQMIVDESEETIRQQLDSGRVWEKFMALVAAQGGSAKDLENLASVQRAPVVQEIDAEKSGVVEEVDAGQLGQVALELGAGRNQKEDSIDPRVGLDQIVKVGESVTATSILARVHARDLESARRASAVVKGAVRIRS